MRRSKSVFRSAVEGPDGEVDAGYLALYWSMAVTVTLAPIVVAIGFWMAFVKPPEQAEKILSSMAMIIGALGVQCAGVIAAVGAFRMGDKPRTPQSEP